MSNHVEPNIKPRLTLQQLATIAASTDGGGCPKCGCNDCRVATIADSAYRVCRNCGHKLGIHDQKRAQ